MKPMRAKEIAKAFDVSVHKLERLIAYPESRYSTRGNELLMLSSAIDREALKEWRKKRQNEDTCSGGTPKQASVKENQNQS